MSNHPEWEIVIGLEVHAQITSHTKLFSPAPTQFGAAPNTQLALLDAAFPGMLPVVNQACVYQAVRAALGIGAEIHLISRFDRKNYFYPDLPQGYQISQYEHPIATGGELILDLADGQIRKIGIERLHIEQDAGKNIHEDTSDGNLSFVDLNRAGIGLMEIVSKPEMRSADEAREYVRKLRAILRYLNVCDGNMEQGSLRADVNVSVRRPNDPLGTRCEIKNLNSIRAIGQAIDYESRRQIDIIERGGKISQETRLFDSSNGQTRSMRSKEDAHDYRYFPDPDLPPLVLDEARVNEIKKNLPELPDEKKQRFQSDYGLTPYEAAVLTTERARAAFFEDTAQRLKAAEISPKLAANWILSELLAHLNKTDQSIDNSPVSPEALAQLIQRIKDNVISGKIAKQVFEIMCSSKQLPDLIIEEKGLQQVTDVAKIEAACDSIIAQNLDKIERLKAKPKMIAWFVGQVMKETQGKANPQTVNDILRKKLPPHD